jgi:hypothetical protein
VGPPSLKDSECALQCLFWEKIFHIELREDVRVRIREKLRTIWLLWDPVIDEPKGRGEYSMLVCPSPATPHRISFYVDED